MKKVETRTEIIELTEDYYMLIIAKPELEHLLDDAVENFKACTSLLDGGPPAPTFIDIRAAHFVSSDARKLYASKANMKNISAAAFLVDSAISRMVGNFFLSFNRPAFPTKLFESKEKALEWLISYERPKSS